MAESSGDSDSDTEDHRRLIEKSYKKLLVMENHFARANGIRAMKDNVCIDDLFQDIINDPQLSHNKIIEYYKILLRKLLSFFMSIFYYTIKIIRLAGKFGCQFVSIIFKVARLRYKLFDKILWIFNFL